MAPQGQATDIAIQAEEIMKLKKQLYSIYAKHTKQSLQVIGERPLQGPQLLFYWNQQGIPVRPLDLVQLTPGWIVLWWGPSRALQDVWHIPGRCPPAASSTSKGDGQNSLQPSPSVPWGSESPPYPTPS